MNLEKVKATFQKYGYNSYSTIRINEFYDLLNKLMQNINNELFNDQVAQQLWQRTVEDKASGNQTQVSAICQTIVEAQMLLQERLQKVQQQLNDQMRRKSEITKRGNTEILNEINNNIIKLNEDKQQYYEDLMMVTQPFNININDKRRTFTPLTQRHSLATVPNEPYNQYTEEIEEGHPQLKWLLYLTLGFCFIEFIVVYGKYQFLNLIVVTCLLSIYLLDFFDQIYVKVTLSLLVVSVVLDIIWMVLYAPTRWNPEKISNISIYLQGYQRFIVFLSAVIIILKIPMLYFLFKYRNHNPDNKYQLSLGFMKIVLSANKTNPISRGISNNIVAQ